MKFTKVCPLFLAAAMLATVPAGAFAATETNSPAPNANLELARQLNQAFVQVAEDVSPSVVVITVVQKATPQSALDSGDGTTDDSGDPLNQLPPDLRRWFRQQEHPAPEKSRGQGSGIIIRKDGFILTNRHVVEDAEKIEVRLKDGRIFPARVRGVDSPSDVAVIKIDAQNLPVAKLADSSKTRVGEFAIAIGAPFALDYTVTFGHVSAKDRSNIIPADSESATPMTDQNFIQTDANINPGNSGGPLINIEGEVIGINTLIRGLRTGIGFAIPINLAREVADKLISDGKFTRSWLGVTIVSYREYPGFSDLVKGIQDGVVVREIAADGPAAKSGLHPGDVITAIDGKTVITSQQLKDEIRAKKVGQSVTLSVFRRVKDKGSQLKIQIKPGEWKDATAGAGVLDSASSEDGSVGNLGLTVETLTRERADEFGVDMTDGVIITKVDPTSLAYGNGIKRGDIITSIDHQPVTNPKQFHDALKIADTKKGVIMNLVSKDGARFEILKDSQDN
jgi:serine protease Do